MVTESSDDSWIRTLLPRHRHGVIQPGGGLARGADYQFYRLVPLDVMQVSVGLNLGAYSSASVDQAMAAFWTKVEALAAEQVNAILLSGAPLSAVIGRDRVQALKVDVQERFNLPFTTTLEATIDALTHLGITDVALASRFPSDVNAAIATYFGEAGITISGETTRDVSLEQARQLTMEQGMSLALEVGREACHSSPSAQAIFAPGGAIPSLHVIPALESEFGKPVITNLSAEVWSTLIRPRVILPISGWGRLLSIQPPR